jgi:PhnB protein
MTTVNIYLTFDGNCEEAFVFYQSVLGGELQLNKFSEMPENPEYPMKEEDKNKIMHVSLPISKETVLMGSDTAGGYGPPIVQGNNFSISVHPEKKEDADKIFKGLSAGGTVGMAMADAFWGSYFGMLTDKFGINWMVNVDLKK